MERRLYVKSSKPSMLKQSKLLSGRAIMNRGRWSGTGGWAGEAESGMREVFMCM